VSRVVGSIPDDTVGEDVRAHGSPDLAGVGSSVIPTQKIPHHVIKAQGNGRQLYPFEGGSGDRVCVTGMEQQDEYEEEGGEHYDAEQHRDPPHRNDTQDIEECGGPDDGETDDQSVVDDLGKEE